MKKLSKKMMLLLLTALLIIGMTTPSMTAHAADTEGINQFVTRLYQVCFGREPDAGGLEDWSNRLATGQETGAQVTYGFVFSQEFQNMNLCNSHYVDALYEAFFGRASDEAGKADWMNRLASGQTRGAVMTGFVNSDEFRNLCASYGITQGTGDWSTADIAVNGGCVKDKPTEEIYNFVTRLYTTCLERDADATGVEDWATRLAQGETGSNVAYGFVSSAEYQNKNADNEEYVNMLYRTMLGREADEYGQWYWPAKLDKGVSREEVFDGFLQSTEFAEFCKEAGIVVGDPVPYVSVGCPHVSCHVENPHDTENVPISGGCYEVYNYSTYVCNECGYNFGEARNKVNECHHSKIIRQGVSATCTTDGVTAVWGCDCGGLEETGGKFIPAFGHNYHDEYVSSDVIKGEDGIPTGIVHHYQSVCYICGDVGSTWDETEN